MPVELRIQGRPRPFVVNEASLGNDLADLVRLLQQPPYAGPAGAPFTIAYKSFETDINKARGRQRASEDTIQRVWAVISNAYELVTGQPLPLPFMKTDKTAKVVVAPVVSTIVIDPAFTGKGNLCRVNLVKLCPELDPIPWPRVIENIYRLGQQEPFYAGFFDLVNNMCDRIQVMNAVNLKLRFYDVFHHMIAPEYKNEKSLGGYKGGASEVLDALSSALKALGPPTKISLPKGDKTLDRKLVADEHLRKDTITGLPLDKQAQDVDRTEVYGNLKFYIEVKADSHTAVQKHCGSRGQLLRIKAVVQTRQGKESKTYGILHRYPAVSITNPAGWLELFTAGAVHIYRTEGFYLFIGGEVFSPDQLTIIDRQVYHLATDKTNLPLTFSDRAPDLSALNLFFTNHKADFPAPIVLAAMNLRVQIGAVAPPIAIRTFTITVSSNSPTDSKQLNYCVQSKKTARSISGRTMPNGVASITGFDPDDVQVNFPGLSMSATSPKKNESYLLLGGRYMFTCKW